MTSRQMIEWQSKNAARLIDQTPLYNYVRVLNSFDMYVMKGDESVSPHLLRSGFWEAWITTWIWNNLKPGTAFIDIGANTGYYSFLALYLDAIVHAFEPNPEYYKMMYDTCEQNQIDVTLYQSAVSDNSDGATLHIPESLHGSASLIDIPVNTRTIEVKTVVLNTLPKMRTVIKIDAEGSEEKIWAGMEDAIYDHPYQVSILMEYSPNAYSEGFIDRLQAFAPLKWINHDGMAEDITKEWLQSQTDWVMLLLEKE